MPTIADVESGIEAFLDRADEAIQDAPVEDEMQAEPEVEAAETQEKEEAEDAPESEAIESLSDLAEALEMSPEDLAKTLKGKVKINGEERDVTLDEMIAGYQKGEAYEQRKANLQEEQEQFRQVSTQAKQALQQSMQQTMQLGQMFHQQLVGEANSPQMQKLREENPGEYAARMTELNKRSGELQQALQWQANQIQAQKQQVDTETAQKRQELIDQELQLLGEKLPNFDRDGIVAYMKNTGFSEAQMDVDNHLWLLMVDKAMKFDKLQEGGDAAIKKVKTLPKVQKPGKPQPVNKDKAIELRNRLKKSGRGKDFTALIENQLNRGML